MSRKIKTVRRKIGKIRRVKNHLQLNHFYERMDYAYTLNSFENPTTKNKMTSVYSSLPLINDDLEKPLLQTTGDETHNNEFDNRGTSDDHRNSLNGTVPVDSCRWDLFNRGKFSSGFWLGLVLQIVSLGSTALITCYFSTPEENLSVSSMGVYYQLTFLVLYVLSQAYKWALLPIICISIDSGLTKDQKNTSFGKCFSKSFPWEDDDLSQQSSRDVFVGRIQFHIGLVFGCFTMWSMIDLYIGASVGVFAALAASFIACLGFCYCMIVIYDRYILDEDAEASQRDILVEVERN